MFSAEMNSVNISLEKYEMTTFSNYDLTVLSSRVE